MSTPIESFTTENFEKKISQYVYVLDSLTQELQTLNQKTVDDIKDRTVDSEKLQIAIDSKHTNSFEKYIHSKTHIIRQFCKRNKNFTKTSKVKSTGFHVTGMAHQQPHFV